MLRIETRRECQKFVRRLPRKQREQISAKIMELSRNPLPHDAKPLKGQLKRFLRADVGEYRVIYRVTGDSLRISEIGKRNDDEVYRRHRRHRA